MSDLPAPLNPPERLLCGPGPSNIDPRVLEAMQRPMLGHLDPDFHKILEDLVELLKAAYRRDDGLTIALSASGTSGMEAGLASLVEPGETVIVATCGFFGNRMIEIAAPTPPERGRAAGAVRAGGAQRADRRGARPTIPRPGWSRSCTPRPRPAWRTRSSSWARRCAGATRCCWPTASRRWAACRWRPRRWGVDYCYSCTQKCLGAPPGISPVSLSERAMERIAGAHPAGAVQLRLRAAGAATGSSGPAIYHHTTPNTPVLRALRGRCGWRSRRAWRRAGRGTPRPERTSRPGCASAATSCWPSPRCSWRSCRPCACPRASTARRCRSRLLREHGIEVGGGLGPDAPDDLADRPDGHQRAHARRPTALLEAFDAVLDAAARRRLGGPRLMAVRDRLHRSELAVPGSNTRALEKAPTLGADVVFLDLEDAVAPDDKEQARENVIAALNDQDWSACARVGADQRAGHALVLPRHRRGGRAGRRRTWTRS